MNALTPAFRPNAQDMTGMVIDLEVTTACNAVCTFCPREAMPDRGIYIDREAVERLADEIRRVQGTSPLYRVGLCGIGEPTLHPHLPRIIQALTAAGARVIMVTNGSRLTPELFESLVGHGLRGIHVSLNAATAETHRAVMRLKDFERIRDNLEGVLELKRRRHPEINIKACFAVCSDNAHEADQFVAYWRERPVDSVSLGDLNNRAGLVSTRVKAVDLTPYARRYQNDPRVSGPRDGWALPGDRMCKVPRNFFFISADGEARLCCMDMRRVTSYGNIRDHSLSRMFADKEARFLAGETREVCQDCSACPPWLARASAEDARGPALIKLGLPART